MTKAFEDIMEFIKAVGPSPVQYGRNGVIEPCFQDQADECGCGQPDCDGGTHGKPPKPPCRDGEVSGRSQEGTQGISANVSCGSAEGSLGNGCAHPSANLAGAISPAVSGTGSPAGSEAPEPQGDNSLSGASGDKPEMDDDLYFDVCPKCGRGDDCECGKENDGRLDAVAGRVPSLNRWDMPEFTYLCEGPDCKKTITVLASAMPPFCELCSHMPVLCHECMAEHEAAGHVSDVMTAAERERQ